MPVPSAPPCLRYFHTFSRCYRAYVCGMKDAGLAEGEEYTDDEDLDNVIGLLLPLQRHTSIDLPVCPECVFDVDGP